MKTKKYSKAVLAICVALMMTGCGEQFPELTEEEYNHTVEYAAGLLMKYSNNEQERLVVIDTKALEKERKKEAERAAQIAAIQEGTKKQTQPESTPAPAQPEPAAEEVTENTEPSAEGETLTTDPNNMPQEQQEQETETETGDTGEVADSSTAFSDSSAITLSSDDSKEIEQDIFLSYQGYMVSSTYPESSKSYVVNADKGKKLLVLRFDLYNGSDATKTVNMIPLNMSFKIIMNGKDIGYSSVTFLPNDLSSYAGKIESRAHESVVVLTQISEKDASGIQSLGMTATISGQTMNINLK
jgi:hypothetical protein